MVELLLDKTKHGCTILFLWSLVDVLNLSLDNNVSNDSKLQTQRSHQQDTHVVANQSQESSPEKDINPRPCNFTIHEYTSIVDF